MPQIKKKTRERYIEAIYQYAMPEYLDLVKYRERVDDCLQGQHNIKIKGKYLPPSNWQRTHAEEYEAYVRRALFYSLTAYAMRIYEGLSVAGSPNITIPNGSPLAYTIVNATVHGRGLHALQYNLNREQLSHGLRGMLVKPTNNDKKPFIVQEFCADSYLVSYFDEDESGISKARFVLLDISRNVYSLESKQFQYQPALLVLGLDAKGEYYQRIIDPFEWADFDVYNPPVDERTVYPDFHGRRLDTIPFTWCGSSSLSGVSLDIPPLLDMCDCELKLFELDAMFAQHLFQSSQETVFFTNTPGNFDLEKIRYGCGAHNKLPKGVDVKVISNNGVGFTAQQEYMDKIMEQVELRRMSIMSSKSHQSGTAVGIVQKAQTAPLRTIINTSGDAITEQLRYMCRWMGMSDKDTLSVVYTPSQEFSHVENNLSEFVSLCSAVNEGTVPMLDSDLYRLAIENGYITSSEEWGSFKKKWELEKASRNDSMVIVPYQRASSKSEQNPTIETTATTMAAQSQTSQGKKKAN